MSTPISEWWGVIREVLAEEWGYDPDSLGLDTAIFADSPAPWMEWVEVVQAIMDRTGMPWPRGLNLGRLKTLGDLCTALSNFSEWPHAG